jgi:hypothetical protein
MLKRWLFLAFLLLLAGCSGNAIFSENFDTITELPEILTTDTLAAAPDTENRVLHLTVSEVGISESGHLYIQIPTDKTDYEVSMRVKVIAGSVRLWARTAAANCSGYALILDPILDNFRLSTVDSTCTLQSLGTRSRTAVNTDQWYDMRMVVRDGMVSGYIDKVQYFEADASAFPTGIPALEVLNDRTRVGQVDIDTLTVK